MSLTGVLISLYYSNIRIFWQTKFGGKFSLPHFFRRIFGGQKFGGNSAISGGLGL